MSLAHRVDYLLQMTLWPYLQLRQHFAMNDHSTPGTETLASSIDDESEFDAAVLDTAVEHCFEKLDKLVIRLHRYPPAAVAVAIGTYLEGLLGALLDERQCTADDVRKFLRDIESGVLEAQFPAER